MKKYEHPLYKGYYANEDGQVFNEKGVVKGTKATVGYWQYLIKGKAVLAHRFVYECVHGCTLSKEDVINHLDHNRLNNKIENLERTTNKGNLHHYYNCIGRFLIKHPEMVVLKEGKSGVNHHNVKLNKEQATTLIMLSLQGVENEELASMFGLHPRYVSLIRHKKRWKSLWIELGLESSETIPSGSRPSSEVEAEDTHTCG